MVRDDAWFNREQHRTRARQIVAAIEGRTVRYGELSPHAHLKWYGDRVLDPVAFEMCQPNGEPDLTELLVRAKAIQPDDPEGAKRVWAYWQERQPAGHLPGRE